MDSGHGSNTSHLKVAVSACCEEYLVAHVNN